MRRMTASVGKSLRAADVMLVGGELNAEKSARGAPRARVAPSALDVNSSPLPASSCCSVRWYPPKMASAERERPPIRAGSVPARAAHQRRIGQWLP